MRSSKNCPLKVMKIKLKINGPNRREMERFESKRWRNDQHLSSDNKSLIDRIIIEWGKQLMMQLEWMVEGQQLGYYQKEWKWNFQKCPPERGGGPRETHTLALYMEYPDLWPKEEKICPLGFYCIVLVWCGRFFTKSPCPERCKGPRCLDDCWCAKTGNSTAKKQK